MLVHPVYVCVVYVVSFLLIRAAVEQCSGVRAHVFVFGVRFGVRFWTCSGFVFGFERVRLLSPQLFCSVFGSFVHVLFGVRLASSCWKRRHVFLFNKKICLLVQQEDMSSWSTRRRVFLLNKKTCFLVEPEGTSSCSTGRHVCMFNRKTCLLAQQEDEQEDMSSCRTRRPVFLSNKKTCLQTSCRPGRQVPACFVFRCCFPNFRYIRVF